LAGSSLAKGVIAAHDEPTSGRIDIWSGLTSESQFGYWFDFGDDWWHQINVEGIEAEVPSGKFPKVIKRVGANPPQYPPEEEAG
jgi:hypothetical protein